MGYVKTYKKEDKITIRKIFKVTILALILSSLVLPRFFDWATVVDELLVFSLISFCCLQIFLKGKTRIEIMEIIIIFAYLVIISLVYGLNSKVLSIILQVIIHLKFFITFYILVDIFKREKSFKSLIKYLFIFSLVGIFSSLLFGVAFYDLFSIQPEYRKDVLRHGGFFRSNFLAIFYFLYFLNLFTASYYKNEKFKPLLISIIFLFLLIITGSRIGVILIPITFFIFYFGLLIKKIGLNSILITILIFIGFILFFTDFIPKTITNLNDTLDLNSNYIRGIMIHLSVLLGVDFFPIGSGAATFGTLFSQGSEVYSIYGVAHRYYFMEGVGIYDSNIASILGEFGFIGIILFIYLFHRFFKFLKIEGVYFKYRLSLMVFIILTLSTRGLLMNTSLTLITAILVIIFINENSNHHKHLSKSPKEI